MMETLTRFLGRLKFRWMRVALIALFRITSPVYFMPGVEADKEIETGMGRFFCVTISEGGISLRSSEPAEGVSAAGSAVDAEGVASGATGA